jgi:plastocyanin
MNKTATMVVLAAILVSGLLVFSTLGKTAYAQTGKEMKVEIVSGATTKVDKAYAPNPVKVQPGTKVTWTNVDGAIHTITSGKDAKDANSGKVFDSKTIAPKKSFSFKFDKAGTYDYYCALHPAMVGKVTVK